MDKSTVNFKTSNTTKTLKERRENEIKICFGNILNTINSNCQQTTDTQKAMKMIKKSYKLLKVKR